MKKILLFILFFLIVFSPVYANAAKYFCTGVTNQFFITFDKKKKTIIVGDNNPKKYWTENDYIFWHSASDYSVYEYTFKNSYNKLSGKLRVKSHHLVTSENNWYDYECVINQ